MQDFVHQPFELISTQPDNCLSAAGVKVPDCLHATIKRGRRSIDSARCINK